MMVTLNEFIIILIIPLIVISGLAASFIKNNIPAGSELENLHFFRIADIAVSFAVLVLIFAFMFRRMTRNLIKWKTALSGSVLTSFLFLIGRYLLGLYFEKAGIGSAYGAAGSLIALLLFLYYSAQIFFFGAEFTKVLSHRILRNKNNRT